MEIVLTIVFIVLGMVWSVFAGVMMDEYEAAILIIIPSFFLLVMAVMVPVNDTNVRWKEWSVCEDNVTQVDSVIIADCDEYYKYPGEPDE